MAWEIVCKPKEEKGLGVKNVELLNKVINLKHIWKLIYSNHKSSWVKWVHAYMLIDVFGLSNLPPKLLVLEKIT